MAKRVKVDLTKARLRSAISNGKHVLADIDHRSASMRRLKDLLSDHISDLSGSDQISHAERLLASRASMIALLCEMSEQEFARAKFNVSPRQLACYLHACGNLTRILQTLGMQRRAKPILTLDQYLATRECDSIEEEEAQEVDE
jgi:hypothetical protein